MPDESSNVGRPKTVSDDELVQAVAAIARADRVATTTEVVDQLPASRRTVQRRLRDLDERGRLRSKKVGARSHVWWVAENDQDE